MPGDSDKVAGAVRMVVSGRVARRGHALLAGPPPGDWPRPAAFLAAALPLVSLLKTARIGGCEGLVMLNRTNRTLSAHLNRLNLGTRSLALKSGVNIDGQTLRSRHAHCVVMRDGMREHAFETGSQSIRGSSVSTRIPGLPIVPSWLIASPVVRAKVGLDVPATLDAWPVPTDRPYPVEEPRNPSQAPIGPWTQGAQRGRQSQSGGRLRAGRGFAGAWARAASDSDAAKVAVSGG